MSLPYHPKRGEILVCDFSTGFREPEMVKVRPVIVVSSKESHSRRLCSVVPISTSAPTPEKSWHHALTPFEIPGWPCDRRMWAKCDMVQTVSFERLNKPYRKTRRGREYIGVFLSDEDATSIVACMRSYLGL